MSRSKRCLELVKPVAQTQPIGKEKDAASTLSYQGGAVLAFEVTDQLYGLPVENVVQIIEIVAITRLPAAPMFVIGVIDFRGQVIPLIDMHRRFNRPVPSYTLSIPIVIGHLNGRTMGLVVDAVYGVLDLPADRIELPDQIFCEEMVLQVRHLLGVARLEDGLLLLLDPGTFLSTEEEESLAKALSRWQKLR